MKRFTGTECVRQGMYFNIRRCLLVSAGEGERLPGTEHNTYRRVPQSLFFILGPLFGLVFIIFLPVLGFVFFGILLVQKLALALHAAKSASVRVLSPVWEPLLAFFHRGSHKEPRMRKKQDTLSSEEDVWLKKTKKRLNRTEDEDNS